MIWGFNLIIGKIFDTIFLPLRNLSPWYGMVVISFLTGLLMLFIFRHTSNQEGIRKTKNKIKAHLLELRLYKDSLNLTLKAQGNILLSNVKYIGYSAKPMLVMIVPILLILIQLNLWFGYQSLKTGETAILKVKLREGRNPLETNISIEPSSGVLIETPPLRIEEEREINWRLRAEEKGIHNLSLKWAGKSFSKKIFVGQNRLSKILPVKVKKGFFPEILNPGEKPLPKDFPVQTIEVSYQPQRMNLFGWKIHWLIVFFVFSILFGFAFKGLLKVEI